MELTCTFKKQFVCVSEIQLTKIVKSFRYKKAEKGTVVISLGEKNVPFYFVKKGVFRYFNIIQEKEWTYNFIKENEIGTILPSFIENKPSIGYIETLEDTEYAYISYEDLWQLFEEIPSFFCWYGTFLEKNFILYSDRFATYQNPFLSLKQRYDHFIKDPYFSNGFKERLSDKIIASFLYVAPETLSRFKNKELTQVKMV